MNGSAEQVDIVLGKAEAVHTCVELYMYRVGLAVRPNGCAAEGVERVEAIDLWLEVVGNHHIEAILVGIEHHDRHSYTLRSQRYTLIGKGDGEVAHTLVLEHTRNVDIARTIATSLDHSHQRVMLRQRPTEVVEILLHCRQVNL